MKRLDCWKKPWSLCVRVGTNAVRGVLRDPAERLKTVDGAVRKASGRSVECKWMEK